MLDQLIKSLNENYDHVDTSNVTRDTEYRTELGLDSMDIMEWYVQIENEFDITISDEEYDNCKTMGDISDLVSSKIE